MKKAMLISTFIMIARASVGGVVCIGESASVAIDSRLESVADSISISWDSSWIGGDSSATVVIADNGVEMRRTTGAGEFVHTLSGGGRHELKYTTYINGVAQAEVYSTTVYEPYGVVAFDANGGNVDESSRNVTYGSAVGELPEPIRTGHAFAGWWTSLSGGEQIFASSTVKDYVTYYAHWTINKHALAFDANGGTGGTSMIQDYGTTIIAPTVARTGFTFMGWSPAVAATMPDSDVTYTAQWEINQYTATFDANGGSGGTSVTQDYGTALTAPEVRRENYMFVGWLPAFSGTMPADNTTYMAQWLCEWKCTTNANDTLTITGVNFAPIGEVSVPSEIDGYPVMGIGDWAFYSCSGLTSVTIPDSVTSIGDGAFSSCAGFTSVTIPNNVMSIGDGAFSACSGLMSITIPNGVTNIGARAFCDCIGLKGVTIPDSVTSIERGAFSGCSGLTSVTIPNSVMSIGDEAFSACSGLTSVTIPNGVTNIGSRAFCDCIGLTGVTIPHGVTSIGDGAFSSCTGLTSVTIPESVKCVGARTFSGCYNIRTVSLSICDRSELGLMQAKFNTQFDVTSVVEDADDVSTVSGVIAAYQRVTSSPWNFSDPVTGEMFAWNASSSTFAYFGEMYMEAGKTYVFGAHFDDYAYVKVDNQVLINVQCDVSLHTGEYRCEETGWHAVEFRLGDISGNKGSWGQVWSGDFGLGYRDDGGTSALQSAWKRLIDSGDGTLLRVSRMPSHLSTMFPDSYRTIQEVIVLDGTETITDWFFEGCIGLSNVSIPDSVTSIERGGFSGCSGLTSVTIPDSVTSIGENAFSGCENLTSVLFSGSVTNVAPSAFSGCVNVTRVTLADCMIRNGAMADLFPSFRKINHVDFVGNISSLPEKFFDGCDSLESVSVGDGVSGFGDNDMRWAVGRNQPNGLFVKDGWVYGWVGTEPSSIVIPEGVKGIASYALCDLYDLESVQLPSTLKYIGAKAFAGDSYLDDLVIPDGVETIGDGAFEDCSYIQTLTLGSGVKSVGRRAFAGCTQLASAEFADGLFEVGDEAFSNCWRMASVSLPLSTTNVGCMAFADCASLTGVTTPTGCGTMEQWFGPVHPNIESVTVPDGETLIVPGMFAGCTSLAMIQLPEGITNIGASAFRDCSSLTEMAVPGGVVSLGAGAFEGCSQISTMALPNGLGELPDAVFAGCDAIDSFVVPASVTNLGSRFCSPGTTAIYYLGNAPAYAEDAYADAHDSLTSYVVRGTKGWDGRPTSRDIPQSWIGHAITTWEATRFDVVFDANGGLFMPDGTNTYACEEITDTSYSMPPAEPELAGYKFIGYWTERNAGSRITSGTRVTLTKAHTLYAHWQVGAKVMVRFNACGGVVDPGEVVYTAEMPYGELPVPTREHYVFTGWWTTANGGREATVASEVPKSDHELFAHWEPASCVIRFHACNGTPATRDQEFVYGDPVTLDANTFARGGYAFAGWATAEGGQSIYPDGKTLVDVAGLQNDVLHLYAVWVSTRYAVRFDSNGGIGRMDSQTLEQDVETNLIACAFLRTGYEFSGWAAYASGPVVYADGATVTNVYELTGADVALYAVWAPIEYAVQYDPNGGTGEMDEQPMVYDEEAPLAASQFTMVGALFRGWATTADGAVEYSEQASVKNLTAVADDVVTLYAVWQEKPAAVVAMEDAFEGSGTVALDDEGNILVTVTNDISGTVEIPDNVGGIMIDLNGHSIVGDGGALGESALPGGPAIRIVSGDGDGETTSLVIVDTSEGEKGQVVGGGESAGIEVDEDAAPSVRLDVDDGISVLNGDGTEQEWNELNGIHIPGYGKVTVPKTWKVGQKVTWKATAEKGSVFAHWEGDVVDSLGLSRNQLRNPSLQFAVPDGFDADAIKAVFIAVDDDRLGSLALSEPGPLAPNVEVTGLSLVDDSESYVTARVSGLPAGLKFDAKTFAVTGKPTKPGVYTVKVTAKNASGYQWAENIELCVSDIVDARIGFGGLPETCAVGEAYAGRIDAGEFKTLSASGLPAGLKMDAKTGAVAGVPTKCGYFMVTVTATYADNTKATATRLLTVSPVAAAAKPKRTAYHPLTVVSTNVAEGTVTGTGVYAAGKKVSVSAKSAKGYVFAGWYRDPKFTDPMAFAAGDFLKASQSVIVPEARYLFAKFITEAEDTAAIGLAVDGVEMAADAYRTNIWCGVYLEWPVAASALSEVKVKVTGLPAGLKFTDKPVTSKIGSGKTAVTVTNVQANTIYGAPTAASKVNAKTGAVTPSAVKVTVTTAGKASQVYQIDATVDALPEWAQGAFAGGMLVATDGTSVVPVPGSPTDGTSVVPGNGQDASSPRGVVSLTVSAAGKVSGKALGDGLTYTLAVPYYSAFALDENQSSNFIADVTASWSYKDGTKTIKTNEVIRLVVQDNGIGGVVTGGPVFSAAAGDGGGQGLAALPELEAGLPELVAWQYNWKVEPWKALGKKFDKQTMAYAIMADGSFSESDEDLAGPLGAEVIGRVTLKFAATGAVTIAGEFVTGFNKKTQKYTTVKAKGSARLVPVDEKGGYVFIYLTPKGLSPHARCIDVPWSW